MHERVIDGPMHERPAEQLLRQMEFVQSRADPASLCSSNVSDQHGAF